MARRTAREIRRLNRFEVLRRIYAAPPGTLSRQELAAATDLSFATVSNLVAELLAAGVLTDAGHESSGGGRPRARLAVNPDRGAVIGVDVAETAVHAELFDLALNVRHSVRRELPPGDISPADVVEHLATAVGRLRQDAGTAAGTVVGAGISVPGVVEPAGGVSVFSPYWAWRDVPLRPLLAERLDLPVYLDNPLKASTVAELWFGAGRDVANLVVVTLRGGVGAGIALDGTLLRGATNSAGEWGHSCLVLDGRPCRCGNRGCVETYVSTQGVIETWRELAGPGRGPGGSRGDGATLLTALADRAAEGDTAALAAVRQTARLLGAAVGGLVNLFNPDLVVLGSDVVERLGDPLLEQTRRALPAHTLPPALRAARLESSALPSNAVSLGAATFALEGFLNDRAGFGPVSRSRRTRREPAR